ncbi:MAG: nucleotidyltransferase [Lachnospiraceae bacterium]|nr:nucleotidyltransferase [Lachnospiraceae bacterium]
MIKTSLVIMAAGIGSRFGGGIKQLTPVGPSGEIIMDYSIYDAMEAGFNEVVFIIRHDLEKDFKEIIGNRIEKILPVKYAFQELNDLPEGFEKPADRTKPWGTGQAVLAIKGLVGNPFVVINADDYYGKEAFVKLHDYLVENADKGCNKEVYDICMAGFILKNTLSENGGVTRGVCHVDEDNYLQEVRETYEIQNKDGKLTGLDDDGKDVAVTEEQYVSMNMWGLYPCFLEELESGFKTFLSNVKSGDIKAEYLLPKIIDKLLHENRATVKLIETQDKWFGVTYQEDKQSVMDAIHNLVENGIYKSKLF